MRNRPDFTKVEALRKELSALREKEPNIHVVVFTASPMMQHFVAKMVQQSGMALYEMNKTVTPQKRVECFCC